MFKALNSLIALKKVISTILVTILSFGYELGLSFDIQGVLYSPDSHVMYSFYAPTKKIGVDEFIDKNADYDIHLAKNEYEGCLIVIRSKFCSPTREYNVEFTGFENDEGDRLDAKVYLEKYVKCFSNKDYGIHPEIMEEKPMDTPIEMRLAYAKNWPFYIEVHADENTKAGTYTAQVRVSQKNNGQVEFITDVKATVWDFALPETSACGTAFGLGKYNLDDAYKLDPSSEESLDMYKKYYEYLVDRKMSPYSLPYDILDPRADEYMSDPRITSFCIPYPDDDELLVKYYNKVQSDPVWAKKGYFYPIDEPSSEEAYTRYQAITDRLSKLCPGYHMVTPFGGLEVEMNGEMVPTPTLQKGSDIVCPISDTYSDKQFREQIEERRADGSEIWWYVCCGPGGDYCNMFTQYEGIRYRMLFWQQKALNVNGILYWETAYWAKVNSPWTDQHTTPWTGMTAFGDGNLFYPGKDGPVPSLRLLLMSSGIEDFDLLTVAENVLGREYVEKQIAKVNYNLTDYTLDDNLLACVRVQVGNDIEAAINK